MVLPVTKAEDLYDRWARRLIDPTGSLDELTLHRIVMEARRAMAGSDRSGRSLLWLIVGYAEGRLGRASEAVAAHRNAVQFSPGSADARLALSASLGRAEQHQEALTTLLAVLPLVTSPSNHTVALINISTALANLGHKEEALDAYQEVLRVVPAADADLLVRVAVLAAALDLHEDAVELMARYLCAAQGEERAHDEPALAVIDRASADHVARLVQTGTLGAALDAVRADAAHDAPTPEEMKFPAKIVLDPASWTRFVALVGASA